MAKKILLADDSVTIQKVVELTLTEPDYEVVSVGTGDEALEQLNGSVPDLILADVHMPGASGLEVARRAKQAHGDLPVLLLVGAFEPFDPEEGESSGAVGHLRKPFDAEELKSVVEKWSVASADSAVAGEASGVADQATAKPPPDPATSDAGSLPDEVSGSTVVTGELELSEAQLEEIARRVVARLDPKLLRDIAWEVLPDLAEIVIKERLRELEAQVEVADS